MAWHHTVGFGVVDTMLKSGALLSVNRPASLTPEQVTQAAPELRRKHVKTPLDENQDFVWESVKAENQQGWASTLLTEDQVNEAFPAGWAGIPSFCHVQPNGKKRRIDNGRAPKHNQATEYLETVTLCTAFHPALMGRLLVATMVALGGPKREIDETEFESGTDDIPNAYRSMLVKHEHLRFNIVMVKEPLGAAMPGRLWFCIMYAMLSGLSSSVVQLGWWSRFLEAFMRRIMWILWMLFVDDSCMVDLKVAKRQSADRGATCIRRTRRATR